MHNNKASKYTKQKCIKLQGKKIKSTIIIGVFNDLPQNNRMLITNTNFWKMLHRDDQASYKRLFQQLICLMKRELDRYENLPKNLWVRFCQLHILAWVFPNFYFSSHVYLFKQWHVLNCQ